MKVGTKAEMDMLAEGSVIMDRYDDVWQLRGGLWCSYETTPHRTDAMMRYAPFVVLRRVKP